MMRSALDGSICDRGDEKVRQSPGWKGSMNQDHAKLIVQNAVAVTQPRWRCYEQSWSDIDVIFIRHGYEQQGFRFFRFAPYLSERGLLSIDALGSILGDSQYAAAYDNTYAKGVDSVFFGELRAGKFGDNGRLFADATRLFQQAEPKNCGRFYWMLLWHMLQACTYLRSHHGASFAGYVMTAYAQFARRSRLSGADFLEISEADWLAFLRTARPWQPLKGIGENTFDFIFGDIVEARFAKDSYKLDSANEYFLKVTGIASLIGSLERKAVMEFLRNLNLPYGLREINKGIYTYCSVTEAENYGYCRNVHRCRDCAVSTICYKLI